MTNERLLEIATGTVEKLMQKKEIKELFKKPYRAGQDEEPKIFDAVSDAIFPVVVGLQNDKSIDWEYVSQMIDYYSRQNTWTGYWHHADRSSRC